MAVDGDGDVIDILVQSQRNRWAAIRFFRKLLKGEGREPRRLITDTLRSYAAAHRAVMPSVVHAMDQYANNQAEVSHRPIRQHERQMRRFTSAAHVQRFVSVHGLVQNLFRVACSNNPATAVIERAREQTPAPSWTWSRLHCLLQAHGATD